MTINDKLQKTLGEVNSIAVPEVKKDLGEKVYYMPSSSIGLLIMEIFAMRKNVDNLPMRKELVDHGRIIEVKEKGKQRLITAESATTIDTVEIPNIDKLSLTAKRLFMFIMIKTNELAVFDGELGVDSISFPLQELVDSGMYSDLNNARIGFESGMDTLTDIKVSSRDKKSNNNSGNIHLFKKNDTGDSRGIVYYEKDCDWSAFLKYYTLLPRYYFKLPIKAQLLLEYIVYLARINTDKIAGSVGSFKISLRAIQIYLQLPLEKGNNKTRETIREPIEQAIKDIEEENARTIDSMELQLMLMPENIDEIKSIKEYLEKGYLQITFKGDLYNYFKERDQLKTKKIEQTNKKREKRRETAKAINLAKKMLAEENKKRADAEEEQDE